MKLLILSVFLTHFCLSFAGNLGGFYYDPDHPDKCVYKNVVLWPGQQGQPLGECAIFACKGDDGFALLQGCDKQPVKSPCILGDFISPHASYPECCKRHVICH